MTGKIKLVHSGGNAVSIAVPSSNPSASEVEFKLPQSDGTSGQRIVTDGSGNLSFASAGASGKILQVVSATKTDVQSTTSTSYVDITGLSVNITPSASNSKILLMGNVVIHHSLYTGFVRILRDSTELGKGSGSNSAYIVYNHNANSNGGRAIMFEDSPSTTSQITYKAQFKRDGGSTLYINAHTTGTTNDYISTSYFSAMEVAA